MVSIQPDQGGSVQVVDGAWLFVWDSGGDDMGRGASFVDERDGT